MCRFISAVLPLLRFRNWACPCSGKSTGDLFFSSFLGFLLVSGSSRYSNRHRVCSGYYSRFLARFSLFFFRHRSLSRFEAPESYMSISFYDFSRREGWFVSHIDGLFVVALRSPLLRKLLQNCFAIVPSFQDCPAIFASNFLYVLEQSSLFSFASSRSLPRFYWICSHSQVIGLGWEVITCFSSRNCGILTPCICTATMVTTAGSDRGNDYRIVHRVNAVRKPIMARKPDPRTGLSQILEMKDVAMDPACPASSSSSSHLQSEDDLMQSGQISWCFPQLGAAVPTFNDVSLKFAETASLFSRHFSGFVEESMLSEANVDEGETTRSSEVEMTPLIVRDTGSSEQSSSSTLEQQQMVVTVPPFRDSASQSDSPLALSNFGGAVSLFNATGAAMMGMGQTLLTGPPAVWQGLVSRVQTTLRGSADDIGWLQKDTNLPPVVDKTQRFLEILGRISHGVHILPDSIVYLLIPGLFSNHGPMYFVDTKKYFSKLKLPCYIARIHSEAAVEKNARELKEYIEELYWGTGKRIILLGHSKGGVDAAAACAKYWPDLKDKVVGLVFAQSPYGGSPVASDILREGQIADFETKKILELIITKVLKGDMQALEDLTYDKRREFVAMHPLPTELLTVSFHTEASRAASVLSTMSHIAHAELPWLPGTSSTGTGTSEETAAGAKLPVVIPLAAAMALCALHLDLRYGEKSDGLVARKDAEVPGSVVVRPEKKLDHAWMVYTPSRKESNDPNAAQMWEALLTLLLEEESARKTASSSEGKSLLDETSQPSSSAHESASTNIADGADVLEKL